MSNKLNDSRMRKNKSFLRSSTELKRKNYTKSLSASESKRKRRLFKEFKRSGK